MRVLIAYGSKMGGTAGIAEMIGGTLRETGLEVEVAPAYEVRDIAPYDVILVGGALYANRWHPDARAFVRRHTAALRDKPVWFFSSGPLEDTPAKTHIPPVRQVQKLMARVGARDHVTFGGRLVEADAKGFVARAMARQRSGDWRDPEHIRRWALQVAMALGAPAAAAPPPIFAPERRPTPRGEANP